MRAIEVLLVEDNHADADLIRENLAGDRLRLNLSVVTDGVQALDFLLRASPYGTAPRPDLMLLDLNLPRMDGRELLVKIKASPRLKLIPVVVLTSSDAETDVIRSYDLGASCYVTKPVSLRDFEEIVKALQGFWFTVVKLPPSDGAVAVEVR